MSKALDSNDDQIIASTKMDIGKKWNEIDTLL